MAGTFGEAGATFGQAGGTFGSIVTTPPTPARSAPRVTGPTSRPRVAAPAESHPTATDGN